MATIKEQLDAIDAAINAILTTGQRIKHRPQKLNMPVWQNCAASVQGLKKGWRWKMAAVVAAE